MDSFVFIEGIYFYIWLLLEIVIAIIGIFAIIGWFNAERKNKELKDNNRALEEENNVLSDYYYKHNFQKDMKNNSVDCGEKSFIQPFVMDDDE